MIWISRKNKAKGSGCTEGEQVMKGLLAARIRVEHAYYQSIMIWNPSQHSGRGRSVMLCGRGRRAAALFLIDTHCQLLWFCFGMFLVCLFVCWLCGLFIYIFIWLFVSFEFCVCVFLSFFLGCLVLSMHFLILILRKNN